MGTKGAPGRRDAHGREGFADRAPRTRKEGCVGERELPSVNVKWFLLHYSVYSAGMFWSGKIELTENIVFRGVISRLFFLLAEIELQGS